MTYIYTPYNGGGKCEKKKKGGHTYDAEEKGEIVIRAKMDF